MISAKVKQLGFQLAERVGMYKAARAFAARKLLVLTYHHVVPGDLAVRWGGVLPDTVSCEAFASQLKYLKRHYSVVSGADVQNALNGEPLPLRAVHLTFDDGYLDNFVWALPILQQYDVSATFFIATDFVDGIRPTLWFDRLDAAVSQTPDLFVRWLEDGPVNSLAKGPQHLRTVLKRMGRDERERIVDSLDVACGYPSRHWQLQRTSAMSWQHVRSLVTAGMTIGAHTRSHQILASADGEDVTAELQGSHDRVEAQIDKPCWAFSYPNGSDQDFRDADKRAVEAAGFRCAFTQIPGWVNPTASDRLALSRISMPSGADLAVLKSRLAGIDILKRFLGAAA